MASDTKLPKRNKRIELHCTQDEYQRIREKAFKANLSIAVYLRECGLSKELKEMLSPEEKKVYSTLQRNLAGIGNNLNQITKRMNQEGFGKNAVKIVELINKIDKILSYGN